MISPFLKGFKICSVPLSIGNMWRTQYFLKMLKFYYSRKTDGETVWYDFLLWWHTKFHPVFLFLNHVHRHLRGGAILATITGCGHLLATAGISYHGHAVHAATGQVLTLSKGPSRRWAQQAGLRFLWVGGQSWRSWEVVSIEVVWIVHGKGIVWALLHVVMTPGKHVRRGRGSPWRRGRARGRTCPCLHHILELGGGERWQLTSISIHFATSATAAITTGGQWGVSAALHSCCN